MKTLQFKTNINCGGCIGSVTPHLNQMQGIKSWKVDTNSPDKILTVETESVDAPAVIQTLKNAGFQGQAL